MVGDAHPSTCLPSSATVCHFSVIGRERWGELFGSHDFSLPIWDQTQTSALDPIEAGLISSFMTHPIPIKIQKETYIYTPLVSKTVILKCWPFSPNCILGYLSDCIPLGLQIVWTVLCTWAVEGSSTPDSNWNCRIESQSSWLSYAIHALYFVQAIYTVQIASIHMSRLEISVFAGVRVVCSYGIYLPIHILFEMDYAH